MPKQPRSTELSQLFKNFRHQQGWTIQRLASACEWDYTTVWRLENGIAPFTRKHLFRMLMMEVLVEGSEWYRKFNEALKGLEARKYFFGYEELQDIFERFLETRKLPLNREELEAVILRRLKEHSTQLGRKKGNAAE